MLDILLSFFHPLSSMHLNCVPTNLLLGVSRINEGQRFFGHARMACRLEQVNAYGGYHH